MHVLQHQNNLCCVEPDRLVWETITITLMQVIKEFSTIDEIHDHKQVYLVMKRVLKLYDKRVIENRQKLPLRSDTFFLLALVNQFFLYNLHREIFGTELMLDEVNSTK